MWRSEGEQQLCSCAGLAGSNKQQRTIFIFPSSPISIMTTRSLETIAGEAVPFSSAMRLLGLPKASVTGLITAGILETVGHTENHERGSHISARSINGFVRLMEGRDYVFALQHRIYGEEGVALPAMRDILYKSRQRLGDAGLITVLGEVNAKHLFVYPVSREAELRAVLVYGVSALGCTEGEAAQICEQFGLEQFHLKALVSSGISLKDFDAANGGRKVLKPGYLQERYSISPDSFYRMLRRRIESLLADRLLVKVGEAGLSRHFLMYESGAEELVVTALGKRYSSHSNGVDAVELPTERALGERHRAAASTNGSTALAAGQGLEARVVEAGMDGVVDWVGTKKNPKSYNYDGGVTPFDYKVGEWVITALGVGRVVGKRPAEFGQPYESIITVVSSPPKKGEPLETKEFVVNPKRA